ncbi:neutral zinc metallopeptidase [Streptomonospora salina]|uniref:Metalloprotease n=1 Tax=Streptomonospora salina TaxID=104205 RepID=A0A841EP87_9ACTN|nr:neutral zinc metallopeptidase [Streptomonospora salina]MBB6001241.1 hypothetical protein [Streptomonospora salina]
MEPTPDGERPAGPSRPAAPNPPPGIPHRPGPPPFPPAAPPPRRHRSAAVWLTVGAAALTALAAFTACVLLVVMTPLPWQSGSAPASADPADHTSSQLEARPAPVEIDVADHPAYGLTVPDAVDCSLPDVDAGSADSWTDFNAAISDCLTRLWRPRLDELGVHAVEPELRVSNEKPEPVGSVDEDYTQAYYDNREMSITVVLPNVVPMARSMPADWQQTTWISLLTHEYGHHVQQLTGILPAGYDMERTAADEDERLEATRRTELQAECLGGMAMDGLGLSGSEIRRAAESLAAGDDFATHGTASNRSTWFSDGAGGDTVGACNTYDASQSRVA